MAGDRTVLVVGAGVVGTAIAWRAATRGFAVTLVDPAPGTGATYAAAGMLAPVTELHYGEEPLLGLTLAAALRYPSFVAELEDTTGQQVGYRRCGTIQVAWDGADLAALRDLAAFQQRLGLDAELLTGRELRRLEPAVAAGAPGGLLAAGDHQVDNRRLHAALLTAARLAGAALVTERVAALTVDTGAVRGVRLDDGTALAADTVVLAAGCWSRGLPGLPAELAPPVRPVKGQTLRLRWAGEPALDHVLRAAVRGAPVYLVPRLDGELVVGASVEEVGFDLRPRAGALYELLRDATTVLPVLGEAELVEVSTGLRPGSPDNAPLIGPAGLDGLVVATGHYRNGVLLTPVTADAVEALLVDGALPDTYAPFSPTRFATTATP